MEVPRPGCCCCREAAPQLAEGTYILCFLNCPIIQRSAHFKLYFLLKITVLAVPCSFVVFLAIPDKAIC